jgi:hypothetical protein
MSPTTTTNWLIVALVVVLALMTAWNLLRADALDVDLGEGKPDDPAPTWDETCDPWSYQRVLMEASGQAIASDPTLSKGSVLYAALVMEEVAETLNALWPLIRSRRAQLPEGQRHAAQSIETMLDNMAFSLKNHADSIRANLGPMEDFAFPLTDIEALELFDGTTDIAVVNSGFALASGFDGAAGYLEVVGSNLSKRNPATGMIDKTADGKWIKGVNYRAPSLITVLHKTAQARGVRHIPV